MKLIAEINGEKREVEIRQKNGVLSARVDDREYELESAEIEPGLFHFRLGARVYEVYVSPNGLVDIGAQQFDVTLTDPRALRGGGAGAALADGLAEIKTAMPGKVVRILVSAGESVAQGQGVIVVEAMKMQNEMKSPKEGTVKEIRFAEGDTVNGGDVLAVIE
jgi:biotin carboxyl carrier protein